MNPPGASTQLYDSAPPPKYYLDLVGASHEDPYTKAIPDQAVVTRVSVDFLDGYLRQDSAGLDRLASDAAVGGVAALTTAPHL
ncbi:MAG: hypothetical protein ACRDY0_06825 [Acidimicrobiales bacterium]